MIKKYSPVLLAITTRWCTIVTPVIPFSFTPNLVSFIIRNAELGLRSTVFVALFRTQVKKLYPGAELHGSSGRFSSITCKYNKLTKLGRCDRYTIEGLSRGLLGVQTDQTNQTDQTGNIVI